MNYSKNIVKNIIKILILLPFIVNAKALVCYPSNSFSNYINQFINPQKNDIPSLVFKDNPNCEKSPILPHLKQYLNQLKIETNKRLKRKDLNALYDMQTYLQTAVIYAQDSDNKEILQPILELENIAFDYLNSNQEWLNDKGEENNLAISQYLTLLTRTLSAAQELDLNTSFSDKKLSTIEHYIKKWHKEDFQIETKDVSITLKAINKHIQIFFQIVTKNGKEYVYYANNNLPIGKIKPNIIHLNIEQNLSKSITIAPNIAKILKKYDSNNTYLYTKEIQIRGKSYIKDITADTKVANNKITFSYSNFNQFIKNWKNSTDKSVEKNIKMANIDNKKLVFLDANGTKDEYKFRFTYNYGYNNNLPREITDVDILKFLSTIQYLNYCKLTKRFFRVDENYIDNFLKNFANNFVIDKKYAYFNRYFKDFGSYKYSGYSTETKKFDMFNKKGQVIKAPKGGIVGWDLSHSRRINWLIEALDKYRIKSKYFTNNLRDKYINTLINKVAFKDKKGNLHFSIFADGTNNWYRVAYTNKPFFGYNPSTHDMDNAFITGSYLLLSKYNPKIKELVKLWLKQNPIKKPKIDQITDLEANLGILLTKHKH